MKRNLTECSARAERRDDHRVAGKLVAAEAETAATADPLQLEKKDGGDYYKDEVSLMMCVSWFVSARGLIEDVWKKLNETRFSL